MKRKRNIYDADDAAKSKRLHFSAEERAAHAEKKAEILGEKLEKAKNWGTVDLIGGGLVSDLAKHGNLDDASQLTNRLQSQLRDFQKELSDISLHSDLTPQISDLLKFADFAFDGLIADWMVLDKISSSLSQAIRTRDRITASLHQLASMQQDCTARQDTLRSQRDAGLSRN